MHHSNIVWAEYMIYISWIHIITAQSFVEVLKIALEKADHEFSSKDLHLVHMCETTPFISSSMGTILPLQTAKLRSLEQMREIIYVDLMSRTASTATSWNYGNELGNPIQLKNPYSLYTITATVLQTAAKRWEASWEVLSYLLILLTFFHQFPFGKKA